MSDLTDRPTCSHCRFPLDEYPHGQRHYGTHTAHVEWYCEQRMRGEIDRLTAEVAALRKSIDLAYEYGWRTCANWMERDDLIADIGSLTYVADRDAAMREVPR